LLSLQKHVRGADRSPIVFSDRRTYADGRRRPPYDRRCRHVSAVMHYKNLWHRRSIADCFLDRRTYADGRRRSPYGRHHGHVSTVMQSGTADTFPRCQDLLCLPYLHKPAPRENGRWSSLRELLRHHSLPSAVRLRRASFFLLFLILSITAGVSLPLARRAPRTLFFGSASFGLFFPQISHCGGCVRCGIQG